MAIGTIKSTMVSNLEAAPQILNNTVNEKVIIDRISVPVTSTDDVGDIILMAPIESNAKVFRIGILNDSLAGSGIAFNLGLYYSGIGGNQLKQGRVSGAVIDADNIGTAIAFSSARLVPADVRFEAADIITVGSEMWEVAGLTEDPGGHFYFGLTVSTVATTPAVGDIVMIVEKL